MLCDVPSTCDNQRTKVMPKEKSEVTTGLVTVFATSKLTDFSTKELNSLTSPTIIW